MILERPEDKAAWLGCNQASKCAAEYTATGSFDAENWKTTDATWSDGDVVLICRGCDLDTRT